MSDLDITLAVVCIALMVAFALNTWWFITIRNSNHAQRELLDEYKAEIDWWHSVYGEHTYFVMAVLPSEKTATGNPYARDPRLDRVITQLPLENPPKLDSYIVKKAGGGK